MGNDIADQTTSADELEASIPNHTASETLFGMVIGEFATAAVKFGANLNGDRASITFAAGSIISTGIAAFFGWKSRNQDYKKLDTKQESIRMLKAQHAVLASAIGDSKVSEA